MAKLVALKRALSFGMKGPNPRDKCVLILVSLINQLDHRRKSMRRCVLKCLSMLCWNRPKLSFGIVINGKKFVITVRSGDLGDYQTVWECLTGFMYPIPPSTISHIFDGGGNLGLFSVVACAMLETDDAVVVEPDADNFALLGKNLAPFPNAVLIEGAITGTDGRANFFPAGSNTGRMVDAHVADAVSTKTFRITSLVPKRWRPERTWLKLDIEGSEYDAILSMLEDGFMPACISMELHDVHNRGGVTLIDRLKGHGYSVSIAPVFGMDSGDRQIYAELRVQ